MSLVQLTKKDLETDQDVRWCPGCGDYAILATVQRTLAQLNVSRDNTVFVSGIGCSSRFPYYMNTYGFHTIHGRAPAIATGLRLARPDLTVWLVTGDGDGLSIGGNHLLHALRRNVDLKILLFNNQIYGLTKGQYSPTSAQGTKAASTPLGSVDYPLNPVQFALAAGATFVARTTDTDAKALSAILTEAHKHKGSAFIEILQNCPVFNDGVWNHVKDEAATSQLLCKDGAPLVFAGGAKGVRVGGGLVPEICAAPDALVHREAGSAAYAYLLAGLTAPEFPMAMGILHRTHKPTFEELSGAQMQEAQVSGRGDLQALLGSGMTWTISQKA